jgi:hypothetical protein
MQVDKIIGVTMQKYPLAPPLPIISDPASLPDGVVKLGELTDTLNYHQRFAFYQNNGFVSIVEIDQRTLPDGKERLAYFQTDFPDEFLTWFPKTLTAFRLPPGQSPYTGMMIPNESVGGEMLSLSRAMAAGGDGRPGYSVYNFSRADHDGIGLMEITWIENFLFQGGLLDFIQSLGEEAAAPN